MNNVLSLRDFENLADEVVANFIEKKSSLNSSILKLAQDKDLNPDQIKRLVEMANTKTFLKLFKDNPREDQNVDFDVADANGILKNFYNEGSPNTVKITKITITSNVPSSFDEEFPDMMRGNNEVIEHTEDDSTESDNDTTKEAAKKCSKKDTQKQVMKLRKVAEELMNRVYESEHCYQEKLDKLASDFCKIYGPDYSTFEKEAVIRYGDEDKFAKHALNDIRRYIRWDKPIYSYENIKVAGLITPEILELDKMIEFKKIQVKYAEGVRTTNKKLEELEQILTNLKEAN